MRGFDLYRITLGYLGVICVLCAVVVFKPMRWIWPASGPQVVQIDPSAQNVVSLIPDAADGGVTRSDVAKPPQAPARPENGRSAPSAMAAGPVDPAELVAAMVAQTYGAEFGAEFGEGDASAQVDPTPSPEAVLLARGSDVAYTIGIGDTLGSLALRFYGDSALYTVIYAANRGLMAAPDRLNVGQVIIIPSRS